MHARALGVMAAACLVALPAAANADFPHVVSRGETLTSVATQDGLTVAALAAVNGLSPNANLTAGTVLQIPPQGGDETGSTSFQGAGQTGSAGGGGGSYVVRPGDTLSGIAARAGTTVGQLAATNGISARNLVVAGTTLTLPGGSTGAGGGTAEFVSTSTGGGGAAGGSYVVQPGDTLSAIAAQAGTTVDQLAATNGIGARNLVVAGTTLTLPGGSSEAGGGTTPVVSTTTGGGGATGGSYVVRPGDTLSAIAAQAGTTVGQLAATNGISARNFLLAGTTLTLPGGSSGARAGTTEMVSTTTGGAGSGSYVVRPGDTLSAIAAQAGTTVGQLAATNGISARNFLLAGTTLTLPGGSRAGTQMVSTSSGTSSAATVPTTTGSGGPPYPTNELVSSSEIASIANAEGVPPALAEAIGWQESGFNNSEVSNVGAVGVMQIVPNTWRWIGDHVATVPLQPASASDNVRAGVLLLHALLAQTGSDSQAAAGYYQGLASIRRNGLYPSTQRYVASVMSLMSRFGG